MCSVFWFREISGDIKVTKTYYISCLELPERISSDFKIFQLSKKLNELYIILKSTNETLHITFQLNQECFLKLVKLCSKDYSFLCHIDDLEFLEWLNVYDDFWYKTDMGMARFIATANKAQRYEYRKQIHRLRMLFLKLIKLTLIG